MDYKINIKPLSINQAFKGTKVRTHKYNSFIKYCLLELPEKVAFVDKENIKLAIEFGFSSKLSDIDNCLKTFIDCLVKKYGVDDRYIIELHVFKDIVKKGDEYIKFKIY
jgi:Holliday junction resolvase RusA-like endonuclease